MSVALKQIGSGDSFERRYRQRFKADLARFGLAVEYERDHAGRDTGVHLTHPLPGGGEAVSPALIWFQLKGLERSTLSRTEFLRGGAIPVRLKRRHVAFWQSCPEPTFIAAYVQAVNRFFLYDVSDIPEVGPEETGSMTIHVPQGNVFDRMRIRHIFLRAAKRILRHIFPEATVREADVALRDADVILTLAREAGSHRETRMLFRPWISKSRGEAKLYVRRRGEWKSIRTHWQAGLSRDNLAATFPYLKFDVPDEYALAETPLSSGEGDDFPYDDTYEPRLTIGSKAIPGTEHAGEFEHYEMRVSLNRRGIKMWRWLCGLRERSALPRMIRGGLFVSVAPFHRGEL